MTSDVGLGSTWKVNDHFYLASVGMSSRLIEHKENADHYNFTAEEDIYLAQTVMTLNMTIQNI